MTLDLGGSHYCREILPATLLLFGQKGSELSPYILAVDYDKIFQCLGIHVISSLFRLEQFLQAIP